MLRVFLGLIAVALMFSGCGDDSSNTASDNKWVSSLSDLGTCNKDNEGETVYIFNEDVYVICHEGFWGEFDEDLLSKESRDDDSDDDEFDDSDDNDSKDKKSNARGKSSSSQKNDVDEYFDIRNENRSSSSKTLVEIKLDVAADDTVLSLSHLNDCNSSHVGKSIYLISLSIYMICTEDGWKEYDSPKPPHSGTEIDAGTNTGKSELTNYFDDSEPGVSDDRHRIVKVTYSYGIAQASELFGECDSRKDGLFFKDTLGKMERDLSPDNLFYCKNGVWTGVTNFFADTVKLGKATFGTFKEGVYAARDEKNMSKYCHEDFIATEHQAYVMEDRWRKASRTETCFKTICSYKNEGKFYNFEGYQFLCHNNNWSVPTIFEMPNTDFSNKDYTYGTLEDERDGHIYKTTQIGSQLWMAENLNYKGASGEIGACYQDDPKNCEISGRFYTWNDYMGDSESNQGICPDGWEVPTNTDYTEMLTYTKDKNETIFGSSLFARGAWDFSWDTYSLGEQVDMYGFSALGGILYEGGGYLMTKAHFCTAKISNGKPYYATMGASRESITGMKVEAAPYRTYCNLRCIKKTTNPNEDAE